MTIQPYTRWPDHDVVRRNVEDRMTRYALNVADLTRYDTILVSMMITPHIQQRQTINPEPANLDGAAIVLNCPAEQGKAIVEFLRTSVDTRLRQYPIRAYAEGPRGGWKRITR